MIQIIDLISGNSLPDFDILWLHLPDSLQTAAAASDPEALKKIRSFVDQGGKLLLPLEAFRRRQKVRT